MSRKAGSVGSNRLTESLVFSLAYSVPCSFPIGLEYKHMSGLLCFETAIFTDPSGVQVYVCCNSRHKVSSKQVAYTCRKTMADSTPFIMAAYTHIVFQYRWSLLDSLAAHIYQLLQHSWVESVLPYEKVVKTCDTKSLVSDIKFVSCQSTVCSRLWMMVHSSSINIISAPSMLLQARPNPLFRRTLLYVCPGIPNKTYSSNSA